MLGEDTVFTWFQTLGLTKNTAVICTGLLFAAVVILLLFLFFRTEIGLAVRATGDNLAMSEANGINTDNMKLIGYMISNGCIALSGSLLAQNNGFADLNSGVGTIVIGLASIIIAEVLFSNKSLWVRLITIVIGAILYRLILAIVFEFNVEASDSKLCLCHRFSYLSFIAANSNETWIAKISSENQRRSIMTTPVLTISDLHQTFEKGTINENHVLRGIDLTMNSGDFITIIGGNGAGKSTLLNSIAGTIPTEQGKDRLR